MTLTAALQAALAFEHQAVYGYGLVVARLDKRWRRQAAQALERHEQRRDDISALLTAMHQQPTPAAPAYRPQQAVVDTATAYALAARIESDAAGIAWDVVAASPPASAARRLGVGWLADAVKQGAVWDAKTRTQLPALPGQPA